MVKTLSEILMGLQIGEEINFVAELSVIRIEFKKEIFRNGQKYMASERLGS